jgi:hypothetical protein
MRWSRCLKHGGYRSLRFRAPRHRPATREWFGGRLTRALLAGIASRRRHAPPALHCVAASLWRLAQADLPALEKVCREELDAEEGRAY